MNETHDRLTAELRELSPHQISPSLKRRIGERLTSPSPADSPPRWGVALAGALAAACLAAILVGWRGDGGRSSEIVTEPAGVPSIHVNNTMPTVLAYHHALSRSPEELAALLGKHAHAILPPDPPAKRLSAFARLNDLRTSMGEL